MDNWIEINTLEDLPDPTIFCWWVGRKNGNMFPSCLNGMLGRQLIHIMFSHYMIIENIPTPPTERRQISSDKLEKEKENIIIEKMKK